MGSDPQKPDVVERGGYSGGTKGPASDTVAYETGTPLGHSPRREEVVIGVEATVPAEPKAMISRDKLARSGGGAPSSQGLSRNTKLGILAVVVVLVFAAAAAALFSVASPPPPPPPAPVEPAPEAPKDIRGVPVQRGINRTPLPPKDAPAPVPPPEPAPEPVPGVAPLDP